LVNGTWTTSKTYPIVKDKDQNDVERNLLVVPSYIKRQNTRHVDWSEKKALTWKREDGKWTECGRIHHTFQGHSMNVVCNMIYMFGGIANNKFTNTLYIFDPRTSEFSVVEDQEGDIPEPRAFHHTSVFGTKIMVYGGFNQNYLNDCYVFDTATNTWAEVEIENTDEPLARERATLAPYAGDKLVLFGGYYCSSDMEVEKYLNDTYVLNLSLTKWIKPVLEGDLPVPRTSHSANFIRGKMYVFGGMTKHQRNLNDIWVLKTSQAGPFEWRKIDFKGNAPEPRHGHSAVVSKNNIIFFGGRGNGPRKFFADCFVFDTIAEQWVYPQLEGAHPTPRYHHRSVALNKGSEIAIFGGVRPKEFLNYPRMYILEVEITKNKESENDKIEESTI
jgi:N-acetylneuraminic acid mutarotase